MARFRIIKQNSLSYDNYKQRTIKQQSDLCYSKNSCMDGLTINNKRLRFSIMINRKQGHVLAMRIKQTCCNWNKHGLFNWLTRSWWHLLATTLSHQDHLFNSKINASKLGSEEENFYWHMYLNFNVNVCFSTS